MIPLTKHILSRAFEPGKKLPVTLVIDATHYSAGETIVDGGMTFAVNGGCSYSSLNPTATVFSDECIATHVFINNGSTSLSTSTFASTESFTVVPVSTITSGSMEMSGSGTGGAPSAPTTSVNSAAILVRVGFSHFVIAIFSCIVLVCSAIIG